MKCIRTIHLPDRNAFFQNGGTWTITKTVLAAAIVLFALTRVYILFFLHPANTDVILYYTYATKALDLGQKPYSQKNIVPYPPLAFWTVCLPRLFDDRHATRTEDIKKTPRYFDYSRKFRGMMFLCDLASFVLLLSIVRRHRPQLAPWAALLYVICTSILGYLLYDRLDAALLMLMLAGLYCWMRSLGETPRAIHWSTLSYAFMGLGVGLKIVPVICLPFLLLADFHARRRFVRLGAALAVLTATIASPFVIQWSVCGRDAFSVFKFHAEREIGLESLYSTLMSLASNFGPKVSVSFSAGANTLLGDLGHAMKIFSTVLLLGFLAAVGFWAIFRWSRYTRQDAYRLACYVIPGSVIFSNILSPQYFIWAFPLLLLLTVEIFPKGIGLPLVFSGLLTAVAVMTTWIFPCHYYGDRTNSFALIPLNAIPLTMPPSALPAFILGLRNFIYLATVLYLGAMLFKRIDQVNDLSVERRIPRIHAAGPFASAMKAVMMANSSKDQK
jgi:hypothetical protein